MANQILDLLITKLLQLYHKKASDPVFAFQYFLAIRFIVSLLVSIIMVKSALPTDQLGFYEVIIFVVTAISFFWSVGIKNALLSFYPSLSNDKKPLFLATVFWILLILSLCSSLIFYVFDGFLVQLFTGYDFVPHMSYGALYLFTSVPLVLIENVLYLRENSTSLMRYTHWSHVVLLVFMCIVAIWSPNLPSFLIAGILWSCIRWFYMLTFIFKNQLTRWDKQIAITFLVFSFPLIFNVLLGSVMDMIDSLFVTHYFDESFFPIFKYGAREMPFSTLLFSSLSAALVPLLIKNGLYSKQVKVRVTNLMHLVFPLALILMYISPIVFPLIYDQNFLQSAFIFNVYLMILSSRVLIPQAYNLALHQHRIIVWTSVLEIIINIILSYWWVQYWGVYGLAMATVVAYFVQKVILIIYNKIVNKISIDQYLPVKWYFIYTSLMILSFFISNFIYR